LWADAVFAIDKAWWEKYIADVSANFLGDKFIANPVPRGMDIEDVNHLKCYGNSGIGSIALAVYGGAEKVVLLGYDCQITEGKSHWHGDHPKGLANAVRINEWPKTFAEFAKTVDVPIYNASRQTALDCFERIALEDML
jgi:hypothetical protein